MISTVYTRANVCKCWTQWIHFDCFTRQEILKNIDDPSIMRSTVRFSEGSKFSSYRPRLDVAHYDD